MKLTYSFSADGAHVLESATNLAPGIAGTLLDVSLLSSADATVAVVIADATGTVFTIGSADYTTRTNYKNDNAAITRNGVTGQLTSTISGLGSGTFSVSAWVKPD